MTPPAGPGQRAVLKTHYARTAPGPIAFLDETYSLQKGRNRYYVLSAVVVLHSDLDPLRKELDQLVPGGWWHTTDELQAIGGRDRARDLLQAFQVPDETCVVVHKVTVADDDKDGARARRAVLGQILKSLCHAQDGTPAPVRLAVMEEQRPMRKNIHDRATRSELIATNAIEPDMHMVTASPGSEHLLWLPDLVCSAYRQKMALGKADLFNEIAELTHVIQLP